MKDREVIGEEGIPVFIRGNERPPRVIRIKVKKRGVKHAKLEELDSRQKKALQLYAEAGCDPKKKGEVGRAAGFKSDGNGNAVAAMDRLLSRKPIVEKIEKACQTKHKKETDEKVAEVLVEQLDAKHPLAKGEKPDNMAILNAAKEINKIRDNYPPKQINIDERRAVLHLHTQDDEALKKYDELTEGK
jgi:hypothetical protein